MIIVPTDVAAAGEVTRGAAVVVTDDRRLREQLVEPAVLHAQTDHGGDRLLMVGRDDDRRAGRHHH